MTIEEFGAQMKRLISVYGKPAYPDERLALIWKEVADFEIAWLGREIDLMIGTQRQAPLVEAFAQAGSKERERRWSKEREQEKVAAKRFMAGRIDLPDADRTIIFATIRARLKGEVSDSEWETFMGGLALLFGPIEPLVASHAALADPKRPGPMTMELDPETAAALAEKQRRSLPYVDN
jgi:hypothetical protein